MHRVYVYVHVHAYIGLYYYPYLANHNHAGKKLSRLSHKLPHAPTMISRLCNHRLRTFQVRHAL